MTTHRDQNQTVPPGCVQTHRELAAFLEVKPRQVQNYMAEGLEREPEGWFNVRRCVLWQADNVRGRHAPSRGTSTLEGKSFDELEREYKRVQIELGELKIQKERGELLDKSEVEAGWVRRVQQIKKDLETMHKRLPPKLLGKELRQMTEIVGADVQYMLECYSGGIQPWATAHNTSQEGEPR